MFHEVYVSCNTGWMQEDADLSPDTEAWLAPKGLYQAALLQIAPSSTSLRWPSRAVFSAGTGKPWLDRCARGFPPSGEKGSSGVRVRDPPARGAHARASAGSPSASCSNNTATRPAAVVVPWPVRVTTWAWPSPATVIDPRTTPFATGANRTGTVVEPPGGMGGGSPAKAG